MTSGDVGAVKALLANGADANERTGGGQTPLILATIFGHTHLISLLLDAGADPQLRDNLGLNAVDWAQRRGATEAIEVLSNKPVRTAKTRAEIRAQPPAPRSITPIEPGVEKPASVSEDERSRRWIAGLKQRIAEESQREVPDGPNIFRPQSVSTSEPQPEIPAPSLESPIEIPEPETELVAATTTDTPRQSSSRKRCPKCNAIYNSDLLAYCAHHFVELVDYDEQPPVISAPTATATSPVMFWMIIIITLTGSVVVGSIVAAFFYSSRQVQPAATASQSAPNAVQKGKPVVDKDLEGKVVSLPVAECPLKGQEAIPGTVVVRVAIGKTGQVKEARASGGDWLLRGAATEAAMKSTFAPEKLRGRDTEGTITYTFEP